MIRIDTALTPEALLPKIDRFWQLSAKKIRLVDQAWDPARGTPVFTIEGAYTTRGWTEWTEGFMYGAAVLQFDATGDEAFLELGRQKTRTKMHPHVTHFGVHDHGFNNVSTFGNLLRLMNEGRIPEDPWQRDFYTLAIQCSGAVQARRWISLPDDRPEAHRGQGEVGYISSFNGPHSLFVDTIRSCRALALSHRLGHVYMGEGDRKISLLGRVIGHARSTARWNIYFGTGRDAYDVRGRTAHEAIFNLNDGAFRCPSSQQGYSPFTTWTRGLAWAMCGYAEELEFLRTVPDAELDPLGGRDHVASLMLEAARATCDFYIENSPTDGIPYWDTGAGELWRLGDYLDRPSDPYNDHEPVDSSAAAIGCQGLLRLGHYLADEGDAEAGSRYTAAGLTVLAHLLDEPYLATDEAHQGLVLHSIYHRPNGWDHVPDGRKIPCGESSMWGDYHAREAALYVQRLAKAEPYLTFFGPEA